MTIRITPTHENARQDDEFKQWLGKLFEAAVREFLKDSESDDVDVEIHYREKTGRVRVFNEDHDFTYSVVSLTGDLDPLPGFTD